MLMLETFGGKKMDLRIVLVLALGLAGCSTSETVYLTNESGQRVTCGPYSSTTRTQDVLAQESLRSCVEDFQRQGYERVQSPE